MVFPIAKEGKFMAYASDIMNTQVVSIRSNATIEEAVKLFAEHKISGLPVVDDNNKVIGVISESDIFEYSRKVQVIPLLGSSGWISPYTDVSQIAIFKKGFELLSCTKVREVMSEKVVTVKEDTSWQDIVKLMKKSTVNRVPVVDNGGKLIGIITRTDLLYYFAEK